VEIPDARAGSYVLRVVNYASATPSYILTTALFESFTRRTEGKRESYTLTCERRDGTVLQRERLFIDRGDRVRLDLAECRRKW
jgi:hypothetical protein